MNEQAQSGGMTPRRWQRIKELFAAAVELDVAPRATYLDTACAGDADLRDEVESLLASNLVPGGHFLDTPALRLGGTVPPAPTRATGRRIGPYELFEELGHGGMGEVYRARRADGQYEQTVAIKLIRSGYEERAFVLERFRTERQILATLDHPNIGRLLDGGATDDGSPYLVMELIEGRSVCDDCDARRLSVTARLKLFLQICSAVQYAHQRLIVHRDIKPTNIIVTADGTPKLLDFGIAKILAPAAETEATLARPMTLAYASPEQIRGEPVTTASDVYSLGVVLYQLLSGRSPYRVDTRTPGGLYRAIEEDDPERPSTAVERPATVAGDSGGHIPAEAIAVAREDSVPRLTRRLSGDLDQVVLKALRKEPDRRYASVSQLSEDIERHLNGFPVSAQQGTWRYRGEKFVRRHKTAMAALAAIALVTLVGVAATVREARIAGANARRAEQRFEQVRQLANAMVFDVHDAIEPLAGATKARELIVRLGLEYLDRLARDGTADESLQLQVAAGYLQLGRAQGDPGESNLGNRAGATAAYRKAIDILDRLHARDPQNREVIARLSDGLVRLSRLTGASPERSALVARALSLRQADATAHPDDLLAQRRFASVLYESASSDSENHRDREAVMTFRQALGIFEEIDRRAPTHDSARNVALCDKRLASLSLRAGDTQAALQGFGAARAIDERLVAADPNDKGAPADLAFDLSDLGTTLRRLNRFSEAQDVYSKAIDIRRAAYESDKNDSRARRSLAAILLRQGGMLLFNLQDPEAALPPLREAAQLWTMDSHLEPERGDAEYSIGEAYFRLGNPREAQTHRALAAAILSEASKAGPLEADQQAKLDELSAHPLKAAPARSIK